MGLEAGDVVQADDLSLTMSIRRMKNRPEFRAQPGLIHIPAAASSHPRHRLLGVVVVVLVEYSTLSGAASPRRTGEEVIV